MDIKEDLEEMKHLNHEELPDEKPHKPWFIILGCVFVIFLMVTWIFARYPIVSIIEGQVRSGRVSGTTLETYGYVLEFDDGVLAGLVRSWYAYPNAEAVLCVHGYADGNHYYLNDSYEPYVFEATYTEVRYQPCDNATILMFHTHPYKSCLASDQDIYTLRKTQEINSDAIMMIMCEGNRYSVYS